MKLLRGPKIVKWLKFKQFQISAICKNACIYVQAYILFQFLWIIKMFSVVQLDPPIEAQPYSLRFLSQQFTKVTAFLCKCFIEKDFKIFLYILQSKNLSFGSDELKIPNIISVKLIIVFSATLTFGVSIGCLFGMQLSRLRYVVIYVSRLIYEFVS